MFDSSPKMRLFVLLAALSLGAASAVRAQTPESVSSTPAVLQPVTPMTPAPPPVIAGSTVADTVPRPATDVLELRASISGRTLYVVRGDSMLGQFQVSVGADEHPTPRGEFWIRKMVWNPRWVPPDAPWARGKTPKEPGSEANPMKTVKIFFREPDYYIHGTAALESLGRAESHGCLRMDPNQAAAVAKLIMEHGGQPREENWFLRVLHFRRQEKPILLDNPIRFVVAD